MSRYTRTEVLEQTLREEITQLRRWAKESRDGGWSTHQVGPMLDRANRLAQILCDADANEPGSPE